MSHRWGATLLGFTLFLVATQTHAAPPKIGGGRWNAVKRHAQASATRSRALQKADAEFAAHLLRLGPGYFAAESAAGRAIEARVEDRSYTTHTSQRLAPIGDTRFAVDAQGKLYWRDSQGAFRPYVGRTNGLHYDMYGLGQAQRALPDAPVKLVQMLRGADGQTRAIARLRTLVNRANRLEERVPVVARLTEAMGHLGLDKDQVSLQAMDRVFRHGPVVLAEKPRGRQSPGQIVSASFDGQMKLLFHPDGRLSLELLAVDAPPVSQAISPYVAERLFPGLNVRERAAATLGLDGRLEPKSYRGRVTRLWLEKDGRDELVERTFAYAMKRLAPRALASGRGERIKVGDRELLYLGLRASLDSPGLPAIDATGRMYLVFRDGALASAQEKEHAGRAKADSLYLSGEALVAAVRRVSQLAGDAGVDTAASAIEIRTDAAAKANRRWLALRDVGNVFDQYGIRPDTLTLGTVDRLLAKETIELARSPVGRHRFSGQLSSIESFIGNKVLVLAHDGLTLRVERGFGEPYRYHYTLDEKLVKEQFPDANVGQALRDVLAREPDRQ